MTCHRVISEIRGEVCELCSAHYAPTLGNSWIQVNRGVAMVVRWELGWHAVANVTVNEEFCEDFGV